MKRRDWAIIATAVVAAAIFLGLVVSLRTSTPQCYYEDEVWLRELPSDQVPARVLNLTPEDLAAHPIIERVVDAYRNPGTYPLARFIDDPSGGGEYFLYPVPYSNHSALRRTNDYLVGRWDMRNYPLNITLGDGITYSWEVGVSDPGYYDSCG